MSASFFSEVFFKANTPVSASLDYADIIPFIEVAQESIIQPRIGKSLYNRLVQSITDEDWNDDELELIKLCRKPAMYWTLYMAMPFLQSKIRNKGIVKGTDQYIQTISRDDMKDLRGEFSQMSGFYMNKLDEWLCINSKKFPQYSDPDVLNKKTHVEPFDFGGFMTYKKGHSVLSDKELILKTIGYRNR